MSLKIIPLILMFAGLMNIATAADKTSDDYEKRGPVSEFEYVSIIVEQNATDGDTEIVMGAKPDSDNGLVKMTVISPNGRKVAETKSRKNAGGLREFLYESPEPAGDAILASYPEGEYRFKGKASDGERFEGTVILSHFMPSATTILAPAQDEVVGADSLTIFWSQVPDAAQFRLEFENESANPEQVFTVNVPADVTSFDVPPSLLVPGADYQVAVATVGDNGNVISVEIQFSTAD